MPASKPTYSAREKAEVTHMTKPAAKKENPAPRFVTFRAMQAACCADLPPAVKHLVHVLALKADNNTGEGRTGQATIARYMGLSRRQVNRLWTQLDASWEAGGPVGTLRWKRYLKPDGYRVMVRPDARLHFDRGVKGTSGEMGVTYTAAEREVDVTPGGVESDTTTTESDARGVQNCTGSPKDPALSQKELSRAYAFGASPHATAEKGTAQNSEPRAPGAPLSESEWRAIGDARRSARRLEREQRGHGSKV